MWKQFRASRLQLKQGAALKGRFWWREMVDWPWWPPTAYAVSPLLRSRAALSNPLRQRRRLHGWGAHKQRGRDRLRREGPLKSTFLTLAGEAYSQRIGSAFSECASPKNRQAVARVSPLSVPKEAWVAKVHLPRRGMVLPPLRQTSPQDLAYLRPGAFCH